MKKIIKVLFIVLFVWLFIPYNILILGSDARSNQSLSGSRSDGIIVARVVPLLGNVKMLSIPRDTFTGLSCRDGREDKITHAFAYGGYDCTKKSVEKLLNTRINYGVVFRFDDVISITSLIDGVEISAIGSFVQDGERFKQGESYVISGERALAYTRHRKTDGALKRDERQRQVIQAIVKKLVRPSGWKYIPSVVYYVYQKMEVHVNPIKLILSSPIVMLRGFDMKQIPLSGKGVRRNGVYYLLPNEEELKKAQKEF